MSSQFHLGDLCWLSKKKNHWGDFKVDFRTSFSQHILQELCAIMAAISSLGMPPAKSKYSFCDLCFKYMIYEIYIWMNIIL